MDFQKQILQRLDRIERKLSMQNQQQAKAKTVTWVKAHIITTLTGWDNQAMRRARQQNLINYRRLDEVNGYEYELESLNSIFIKNQHTQTISN
ncbi:hypothetical protein [Pinibacter soli]|uniref:Uncharacterized protein n=1 Tax=Pinibacter soli TaxID=3044211 RepID=A0ABT6RBT0_9BACT|nr:hypothetical protein [Pinibacter soli]MDI3319963.1 hypothetical protein [Pinibacter soli]